MLKQFINHSSDKERILVAISPPTADSGDMYTMWADPFETTIPSTTWKQKYRITYFLFT